MDTGATWAEDAPGPKLTIAEFFGFIKYTCNDVVYQIKQLTVKAIQCTLPHGFIFELTVSEFIVGNPLIMKILGFQMFDY